MGGELHQCSTVSFQAGRRRHNTKCFCALRAGSNAVLTVKYAGAGPHPSRSFPACPWKICVAASRLPCLFCLCAGGARRASVFLLAHVVGIFVSHASRASLVLSFLLIKKQTHIRRKTLSSVGLLLCLRYVSKGEPPKARRKKRTGIPVHASHEPGVRRRAVRAGRSLFVRPSSYPLPGPAPGCRPAIRKRDGAVPAEPQEAGRADASRSLYCFGGMSLCRFTSRCFRAGNYKLSGRTPRRQALFLPAGSFFLCYFPFFSGEE